MQKTEREVAKTFGLLGPEDEHEVPHYKSPIHKTAHNSNDPNPEVTYDEGNMGLGSEEGSHLQKFLVSESAELIKTDQLFEELFNEFYFMLDVAYENEDYAQDMPAEDDRGPIEYKLRLTNLTMEKLRKRTT